MQESCVAPNPTTKVQYRAVSWFSSSMIYEWKRNNAHIILFYYSPQSTGCTAVLVPIITGLYSYLGVHTIQLLSIGPITF